MSTSDQQTALVTAAFGKRGKLLTDTGEQHAFLLKGRKLKPVCGDLVQWSRPQDGAEVILENIEPRRNTLLRSGHKGAGDALAANLDVILVVMAIEPKPDFYLTDRYIAGAESMGSTPVIVHNKADLGSSDALDSELARYKTLGYQVITASSAKRAGVEEIAAALSGNKGILVGQSGVGKSSLINALIPDADVAVSELSSGTLEGKHTTTASMMHRIAETDSGDGWLIDSPGVRDFLPYFADTRSVQSGFIEIEETAQQCRFANCQHLREPNCAVKNGAENGTINARRYESYKRLYHMTEQAQPAP